MMDLLWGREGAQVVGVERGPSEGPGTGLPRREGQTAFPPPWTCLWEQSQA